YAQRGPAESIVSTLSSLKTADANLSAVVLDGLSAGWPADAAVNFSDKDITELHTIMSAIPLDLRDRMLLLADRWNKRDLFSAELQQMADQFRTQLADPKATPEVKIESARRIIAKWNALTPTAQRSALAMTLRKSDWTSSLLDAIAEGKVNGKDLQPQDWQ